MDAQSDPKTNLKTKVDISDLCFFYGASKALKNITLPLYDRKVTAFIGPSGCGKSTLLRAINRIYELYPHQHAEGTITLDGENILSRKLDVNVAMSNSFGFGGINASIVLGRHGAI